MGICVSDDVPQQSLAQGLLRHDASWKHKPVSVPETKPLAVMNPNAFIESHGQHAHRYTVLTVKLTVTTIMS